MEHTHAVYDDDLHFLIDSQTREITNAEESKVIQGDKNSEVFVFEAPRSIEGHDMTMCNSIEIHSINVSSTGEITKDISYGKNIRLSEDSQKLLFDWLIPDTAIPNEGTLSFAVRFTCVKNNVLLYAWNTAPYENVSVGKSINNSEAIIEQYADVLNDWKKELEDRMYVSLEQTQEATEDNGINIWTATFGDGSTSELKVRNGSIGPKGDSVEPVTQEELDAIIASGNIPDNTIYLVYDETSIPAIEKDISDMKEDITELSKPAMELLWENASPTSSFTSQTITLDLSEYIGVLIGSRYSTDSNIIQYHYIPVGKAGVITNAHHILSSRQVIVSTSDIKFYSADVYFTYASGSTDARYSYPIEIYGVRG